MNKQEYAKEVKRLKEKKQNIREVIAHAKQALAEAKQYLKDHDTERLKLECIKLYGRELKEGDIILTATDHPWTLYFKGMYDSCLSFTFADEYNNEIIPGSGHYWVSLTNLRQLRFSKSKLLTP